MQHRQSAASQLLKSWRATKITHFIKCFEHIFLVTDFIMNIVYYCYRSHSHPTDTHNKQRRQSEARKNKVGDN
jgi:hypothetical protein